MAAAAAASVSASVGDAVVAVAVVDAGAVVVDAGGAGAPAGAASGLVTARTRLRRREPLLWLALDTICSTTSVVRSVSKLEEGWYVADSPPPPAGADAKDAPSVVEPAVLDSGPPRVAARPDSEDRKGKGTHDTRRSIRFSKEREWKQWNPTTNDNKSKENSKTDTNNQSNIHTNASKRTQKHAQGKNRRAGGQIMTLDLMPREQLDDTHHRGWSHSSTAHRA